MSFFFFFNLNAVCGETCSPEAAVPAVLQSRAFCYCSATWLVAHIPSQRGLSVPTRQCWPVLSSSSLVPKSLLCQLVTNVKSVCRSLHVSGHNRG